MNIDQGKTEYKTQDVNYGVIYVLFRIKVIIFGFIQYILLSPKRSFFMNGARYYYFYHRYNMTWENERCVEIPLIQKEMIDVKDMDVLEVGNVLSHYFDVGHEIVDKYEIAKNVINKDVVELDPERKYRLIISISTLEHVGWDEYPRSVGKIVMAIAKLRSMLSDDGKLILTLPLGYNLYLDELIYRSELDFDRIYFMKRINGNHWIEVTKEGVCGIKYGYPFRGANGLVMGVLESTKSQVTKSCRL